MKDIVVLRMITLLKESDKVVYLDCLLSYRSKYFYSFYYSIFLRRT